jgi:beta-N-acetylhexosaminidase
MAGMTIPMSREKAVPLAIAAGCDMFLFTKNLEEDYEYMRKGIETGIITKERLEDALTRILGVKVALKLPRKQAQGELYPPYDTALRNIGTKQHKAWARECADKAITIVKEEPGLLPVTPSRYKKVLFYDIESQQGVAYSVRAGVAEKFKELLEKEGFDIDVFKPASGFEGLFNRYEDIPNKYDLIIYLANMATKSNQTTVRIEWAQPMGANVPVYMEVVPTIFISVENPYHLIDVPRVKTYINTYSSSDEVLEALVEKLSGRSEFKGKSPVDAFCGMWDTRL